MSLVTDEYHQQMFMQKANEDSELDNIYVSFLCICFLRETLITSGDDGFLYLWEGERIVRRIQANESSIFALNCNPKLGLLISGGLDGTVTLWRLLVENKSNVKSLERLKVFSLRKNLDISQAIMSPECNIQSLVIGYNRIIAGMRSGSIFEMKISEESQKTGQP
jgi:WD40 repeat protein